MKKNSSFVVGLAILLAVLLGGGGLYLYTQRTPGAQKPLNQQPVRISCAGGSEKSELMADPDVKKLMQDKYGLAVDYASMGSYKQVMLTTEQIKAKGYECLWPSSASARSVFEAKHGSDFPGYRAATVLQSPEVIYSGPSATEALKRAKLVTTNGAVNSLDIKGVLLNQILANGTWQKLKAGDLTGPVRIGSTDARTSNSGFTLAQLELTVMATQDLSTPPTLAQARKALPTLRQVYETSGLQAASSDDGFRQWLLQGGEYSAPLYAGYENQVIQHWIKNGRPDGLMKEITMLYPNPTIYADHPVLALEGDGGRLIEAMQDPEIQKIAWERYGFRSGTSAGINDVKTFDKLPLQARVRTIPAPNADVTLAMLACLESEKNCA
ncbi:MULTISPECIES: hypothetical protein [unclassified Luteococcus]|uniref:hypothetical protein n=1 Tax=unclassified Luteococcus TaxID=2639923 RepID=UPI00313E1D52